MRDQLMAVAVKGGSLLMRGVQFRSSIEKSNAPRGWTWCAGLIVLFFGAGAIFPLTGDASQAPSPAPGTPADATDEPPALYSSSERQKAAVEDQQPTVIRQATAYNVGDPAQTDGNPCITADGSDACEELAQGEKICAANFVPMGTRLMVEGIGICTVKDRLNRRYKHRIDIAMQAHEKQRAIRFGIRNLKVSVLKEPGASEVIGSDSEYEARRPGE